MRVIQDMIDTLIVENVINIADLPEQAQAKLVTQKTFRPPISRHSLRLFDDSDMAEVIGGRMRRQRQMATIEQRDAAWT